MISFQIEIADAGSIEPLAELLVECVAQGASVSFMHPLSLEAAGAFWREVFASAARGERAVLIAQTGDGILGTVQVIDAWAENQPHRADIAKMLVHPSARRLGIGLALLEAAEEHAREQGKTLLVLDAVTGGPGEALYLKGGWQIAGVIPDYALDPFGAMCSTTYMYKKI